MADSKKRMKREEWLHVGRAVMAIFALLIAAGHLAFTSSMTSATPMHVTTSNSLNQTQPHPGGFSMPFNEFGFWFDVEVIAYSLIAVVFLLGLRTWYVPSVLFNLLNIVLYFGSGLFPIPGLTQNAFPGRFDISFALSTTNILAISWIAAFIIGLILLKYDPGSELDKLLVTRRDK